MPPTRTEKQSTTAATTPDTASPEPQQKPERSRNAKAQARHREKRKAYIDHLEKSVASLKSQIANMGISPVVLPNAPTSTVPSDVTEANEARLHALAEENERLKLEIRNLRATIEAMSSTSASTSRSSGSRAGITPPATALLNTVPIPGEEHHHHHHQHHHAHGGHGRKSSGEEAPVLEGGVDPSSSSSPFMTTSTSTQQLSLNVNIPRSPSTGLGISGIPNHLQGLYGSRPGGVSPAPASARLGKSPLSTSHLAHPRYSLPSPLPSTTSASTASSSYAPSPFTLTSRPLPNGFGLAPYDMRGEYPTPSPYDSLPPSLAPPSATLSSSPRESVGGGSAPVSPPYARQQQQQQNAYDFGGGGQEGGWSTSSVRDVNVM